MSLVHDKKMAFDGPSLKVQFPKSGSEALLYHAGISLKRGKMYRLSFSARSNVKTRVEFVPLMASAPWGALGGYACFSVDSVFKTFTYFFLPTKSSDNARVNFKCNATLWIDNVTLCEVEQQPGDGLPLHLIYNPADGKEILY